MPQITSTLLLVDDDPAMVRLVKQVISKAFESQIQVEALTDPSQARERLNRGGVDIFVTDLEMPGINGLDLLRCAKERNACTQILFLTGNSTQEALMRALELGATDYLLKPMEKDELLKLVRQAHERLQRWKLALAKTWRQQKPRYKLADLP